MNAAEPKRSFSFARARRKVQRALRPGAGPVPRGSPDGALPRQKRAERFGLPYFAGAQCWLRRSLGGESASVGRDGPEAGAAIETGGGADREPRFRLQRAARGRLQVGEANDPYEREAEAVADSVGGGQPAPRISRGPDESPQGAPAPGGALRGVRGSTEEAIARPGLGQPLSREIREEVEPRVGADLGDVRVHSDERAQRAASDLGARAFASGPHIFLGRGESAADQRLMAHEATHVVQQGSAAGPAPVARPRRVQRLLGVIMDEIASYARHIPGYTLFTVIIGFNPLTGSSVARNATNLLEGLMGLVPFGTAIFDKLNEHGILQDAFNWVRSELGRLDLSVNRIERTLEAAWDDVRLIEGFSYNLRVLERHFGRLYRDVVAFAESLISHIIAMIKEVAIGLAERLLSGNRAWALIKKILRYDPLRGEAVHATTVEILEDFLVLIGKQQELEQMRVRGTLQKTADWLDTQIGTFTGLLSTLSSLFADAWEAIQPRNLPNLGSNLRSLAERAFDFLRRVWDFAVTVAATVLQLIKDALLSWLKSFATDIPGYHLLTVILEKDPFTDERVPRTPTNLIRGFMSLMPGGERQFQQLQESGVIAEAAQRIETAMTRLGITWEGVKALFLGIWNALGIRDLIDPIGAFRRITASFGGFIRRLFEFVVEVVKVVVELVLKLMNFPSDILGRILGNMIQAIEDIKRDPIRFLKNLLQAVKLGLGRFFDNILQHLLGGLTEWLFGNLRKAGIEPPTEITLESVLRLVMQILGITAERLWQKLAERIGQENVDRIRGAIDRLTGIWTFVRDVQERGVAAIWERIESQIAGLWDMVLEKARDWIMTRVVERVVARLISMLDPTGVMAVVNSFIAFFNAVQSAIEYFREMLQIVDEYVSTVVSIARGAVEPGARKLESGLARSIPVAIGFLANQVGLGNIADKLQEIIQAIRGFVDRGIDWLMDQAGRLGQSVLRALGLGGRDQRPGEAPTGPGGALSDTVVGDTVRFSAAGEQHRVWIASEGSRLSVMVASQPTELQALVSSWIGRVDEVPETDRARTRELLRSASGDLQITLTDAQRAKLAIDSAQRTPQDAGAVASAQREDDKAEADVRRLAGTLGQLFEIFNRLASGPLPVIGPHRIPGPAGFESHHVPEARLAIETEAFYGAVGRTLSTNTGAIGDVGRQAAQRASRIGSGFSGGNSLPAILIHDNTHRRGQHAVHRSVNSAEVLESIQAEAEANKEMRLVLVTQSGTLRASISGRSWRAFIRRAYSLERAAESRAGGDVSTIQESDQGAVITVPTPRTDSDTFKDIAQQLGADLTALANQSGATAGTGASQAGDAVRRRVDNTAARIYESALRNAASAVRAALRESNEDGDKTRHPGILSQLEQYSRTVWRTITGPLP